jgi:hypothetical protein
MWKSFFYNLCYICVTIVLIIINLLFYLRFEDFLLVFENCKRKGNKLLKIDFNYLKKKIDLNFEQNKFTYSVSLRIQKNKLMDMI